MDETRASEFVTKLYDLGLITPDGLGAAYEFAKTTGAEIFREHAQSAYGEGLRKCIQAVMGVHREIT